jgi:hypothetical protein
MASIPKGTPTAIVERFNAALNKVPAYKAVAEDLAGKGVTGRPGTPRHYRPQCSRTSRIGARL